EGPVSKDGCERGAHSPDHAEGIAQLSCQFEVPVVAEQVMTGTGLPHENHPADEKRQDAQRDPPGLQKPFHVFTPRWRPRRSPDPGRTTKLGCKAEQLPLPNPVRGLVSCPRLTSPLRHCRDRRLEGS